MRIEGICAECREEMDLVAADKRTGANWVCIQCADQNVDAPFYTFQGEFTKMGEAAWLQYQSDNGLISEVPNA